MRYLMERQGEILEGIAEGDLADGLGNTDEGACLNTGETADEDAASRSAELRRRAVSRRAAKRQQQWGTEE